MTENLKETPPQATGTPKALKDLPTPAVALPPEPVPDAFDSAVNTGPVESVPPAVSNKMPEPHVPPPNEEATKLVENILETSSPEPIVKAAPPPKENKPLPKGGPKKGLLLAVLAILLFALPIGVYYISKQNEALTESRSKAWGTGYQGCNKDSPSACGGHPELCHCQDGTQCTETACEDPEDNMNSCGRQGRSWCESGFGNGYTCCNRGWTCCDGYDGCCEVRGDNGDDDDTPPPTATPTPTSVTPVCQNIKIYKGGVQVTPSTLKPGDAVVLAVKGNLAPTKAHFRVNGGNWQETTTKNSANEWTLNYTIPSGVTQFVIEGEVFTNGAWR